MGDEVDGWREVGEIGLGFSTPERQEGWDGGGDPGEEEGGDATCINQESF